MKRLGIIAFFVLILLTIVYFLPIDPTQESERTLSDICGALWQFDHHIADPNPLAKARINDLQIGDLNGDHIPDIWTSGRTANYSGAELYQMVWYEGPDWKRHEIAKGDYKYGTLIDVDRDGDLDVVASQYWFENTGSLDQINWPKFELGYTFEPDLVHAAEIDADGRQDLVLTTKKELY